MDDDEDAEDDDDEEEEELQAPKSLAPSASRWLSDGSPKSGAVASKGGKRGKTY